MKPPFTLYLLSDVGLGHLARHTARLLCILGLSLVIALASPLPPRRKPHEAFPAELELVSPQPAITPRALPQERHLELTARVLLRLEQSESQEINPHLRDDIRIAWITVFYAARNEPQPHVRATYAALGLHPDKVFPAIVARRQAMLGADYDKFFAEHPPKKPPQSVKLPKREERLG